MAAIKGGYGATGKLVDGNMSALTTQMEANQGICHCAVENVRLKSISGFD